MSVMEVGLDGETAVIAELVESLRAKYPQADPQGVSELVHSLWAKFDGARFRDFIPVLVEHSARETLTNAAGPSWST